jgi:hypothetical protein
VKRWLPTILVVSIGLLTEAAGAILYPAYKPQVPTASKEQMESAKGESVHARGPAEAAVTNLNFKGVDPFL